MLREARALGAVQLGLSGGEPLVRDDLEPIVAEAHRLGFYTNLITSGVGLTEARMAALKAAGLDHIQLSFQDSTRQMNDFLSSTRTFELKSKVAALIKRHGYPMVLNVVLHRLNIDHVEEILDMAERMGAEYVELANTQYYGWAWHNRAQLLPSRRAAASAPRRPRGAFASALGGRDADLLRRARLFRDAPEALHERAGLDLSDIAPDGTALPCHAARMLPGLEFPNVRDASVRADLVRLARLQPLSRRWVDEGAVPQLPGEGARLRRLPLPGLPADRRCGEADPVCELLAAPSSGDRGGRPRRAGGTR